MTAKPPPVARRFSYRTLWRDFYEASHRRSSKVNIAPNPGQRPLADFQSMNVATVYPEEYAVNQPGDQNSTSEQINSANMREEEANRQQQERRQQGAKDIVGVDEVTKIGFLVPLLAETLGTCILVIVGCASCLTWDEAEPPSTVQIAFTFGLTVASLAQVLGPLSGCHVNPGVTLGLLFSGNCTILKSVCFILCQCCGAIAGSAILKFMVPDKLKDSALGMTMLNTELAGSQGVVYELIITFLLVLVVHAVTDPKREDCRGWAPLAIGLTITACHLAVIPATGSSMNPARSFGPAVIVSNFTNNWIYWVGPLCGGIFAGLLYRISLRVKTKDEEAASYDF